MVPDNSVRIPRAPTYSGTVSHHFTISDTGLSPSSSLLPRDSPLHVMSASLTALQPRSLSMVWAPSAFARRYLRNRSLLSLPAGTEMFQFPASRHASLFIHHALTSHYGCGFPHSDIDGSLPAYCSPRRISLFAASFFASLCLGIRHTPFLPLT